MVTEPESMDQLVYHTRRVVKECPIHAWVYRGDCPKCKKGKMGKPVDNKTGKPKIRAKEYVCPECNYTVEKEEYEETLQMECKFTCPHCKKDGEVQVPFKRKKVQVWDDEAQKKKPCDAVRFPCPNCGENVDVVKKMKA